jgi:hypothetical protein
MVVLTYWYQKTMYHNNVVHEVSIKDFVFLVVIAIVVAMNNYLL